MFVDGRRLLGGTSLLVLAAIGGCTATTTTAPRAESSAKRSATTAPSVTANPATTAATATPTAAPTTAPSTTITIPPFSSAVSLVSAAQLGATWHPGCPVDPSQLSLLTLSYWGFDNQPHAGTIVVNASVDAAVIDVFSALYAARFPIQQMVPESAYGGDDNAAAAADDTSGFNCRYAVAPGPPQWSVHAYGEAVDVNDLQNPYVEGSTVIPPAGAAFEDRFDVRPGMAVPGDTLVEAFASVGWQWGGRWSGSPDYQHFSSTGG
jgi:D-alanyl-D-alanine carboxypeptidase